MGYQGLSRLRGWPVSKRSRQKTAGGAKRGARGQLDIRLDVTPEELARFRAAPGLADGNAGAPASNTLRSVFFDTADHALRRLGVSLSLSRLGKTWLQTVHAAKGPHRAKPRELTCAVDRQQPDLDRVGPRAIRDLLRGAAQHAPLEPIFETVVERTTFDLAVASGRLRLSLDEGVVRAGDRERPLHEIEITLTAGTPGDFLAATEDLLAGQAFRVATISAADRGYDLMLGRRADSPEPAFAAPVSFRGNHSCREVLRRIVGEAFRQITANRKVVLDSDDPEGAHQLRVGLTRLRAALKLFRPLLTESRSARIEAHARTLARAVGELRDVDVLMTDIHAPATAVPGADPEAMAALKAALASHRLAVRDKARAALSSEDWSALMLELTLWPATLGDCRALDRPVSQYARQALDRTWRKIDRMGRRIDDLDAEQRHDMRKGLKKMRYGAEFLRPLYPARAAGDFTRKLKILQALFGYMNDVETARAIETIAARYCLTQPTHVTALCMKAAGFTLGWHTARLDAAWHDAARDWHALKREKKFWR